MFLLEKSTSLSYGSSTQRVVAGQIFIRPQGEKGEWLAASSVVLRRYAVRRLDLSQFQVKVSDFIVDEGKDISLTITLGDHYRKGEIDAIRFFSLEFGGWL